MKNRKKTSQKKQIRNKKNKNKNQQKPQVSQNIFNKNTGWPEYINIQP